MYLKEYKKRVIHMVHEEYFSELHNIRIAITWTLRILPSLETANERLSYIDYKLCKNQVNLTFLPIEELIITKK